MQSLLPKLVCTADSRCRTATANLTFLTRSSGTACSISSGLELSSHSTVLQNCATSSNISSCHKLKSRLFERSVAACENDMTAFDWLVSVCVEGEGTHGTFCNVLDFRLPDPAQRKPSFALKTGKAKIQASRARALDPTTSSRRPSELVPTRAMGSCSLGLLI